MTETAAASQVQHELALARDARRRGNEGRARVCARRAAGAAARAYLERRGIRIRASSVLDQLSGLVQQPGVNPELKRRINLLLLRVDPEFKIPGGVDLIAEAEALCRELLEA